MAQHTPGPWSIRPGPFGSLWVGPLQAPAIPRDAIYREDDIARRDADARLGGAAPDMLAALRFTERALSASAWLGDPDTGPDAARALDMARAAIAKAEGR